MASGVTPTGKVSFPNVFKPQLNKLNQKNEYSLDLLFSKADDLSGMRGVIDLAIEDKWGDKKPKNLVLPFKDGNDKLDKEGNQRLEYKDTIHIRFKNESKPGLVDRNKDEIIDAKEFYGGCFARVHYSAYAYEKGANKGVTLYLQNIQKVKDGEPLGGGVIDPDAIFEVVEAPESKADNSDLLG